jgi:hypothetical protein
MVTRVDKVRMATQFYGIFDKLHNTMKAQPHPEKKVVVVVKGGNLSRMNEAYSTFGRNCWKQVNKEYHMPKAQN